MGTFHLCNHLFALAVFTRSEAFIGSQATTFPKRMQSCIPINYTGAWLEAEATVGAPARHFKRGNFCGTGRKTAVRYFDCIELPKSDHGIQNYDSNVSCSWCYKYRASRKRLFSSSGRKLPLAYAIVSAAFKPYQ